MPMTHKQRITHLENQGENIGVRGVLFIDWDDGVSTALDPHQWTWDGLRALEKHRQAGTPIDRIGSVMGKTLTEAELNTPTSETFPGCTSQAQAERVAKWYKVWMP